MLVLKSWLKNFVDINLQDEELSDKLSLTGTLVEEIINTLDSHIVVSEIRAINPHPDADRLQIATVFNGKEELQIVCGAPNIAVGQKVPLALIGAKIQDLVIKQAQIRGIDSFGMMCSDRELGLSEEHAGIKILPDNYEIGKPLNDYIEADTVFDIEITPNRGDSLSHLGIAREIAVITNEKLKLPEKFEIKSLSNNNIVVRIDSPQLCSQYSAIYIKSVKVGQSPDWLKKRLNLLGARSINNIVDITNYILLDWGQPLHAFDADKISDKNIIVRQSYDEEKIVTLDGQVRALPEKCLVIADSAKAIAVAGVMGGSNSEVDSNTVDIIIESAEFDPASVRKTSKLMGLSTDASYRFERGIDSGRVLDSAKYAAKMITEIAGGTIEEVIYVGGESKPVILKLNYDKINSLLGLDLKNTEIDNILSRLGFEIEGDNVVVPLCRHDIGIWQDLAEEIGRVYGYEKIKPIELNITTAPKNTDYIKKEFLKDSFKNLEFCETVNYVFVSAYDAQIDGLETKELLEVKNPMQKENKYLRNSLVPGLIKNIAKNPSFDPVLLFEIGHIFNIKEEKVSIAFAASGKDAKKKMEAILNLLKEKLKINNDSEIKELSIDQLSKYKIRKSLVLTLEFTLDKELDNLDLTKENEAPEAAELKVSYKQVSKYPPAVRDLAFIVGNDIDSSEIMQTITDSSEQILLVDLFDEFTSPKFGVNKKNVAYHIYLQDINNALLDSQANEMIKKIVALVEEKFKAKLRD